MHGTKLNGLFVEVLKKKYVGGQTERMWYGVSMVWTWLLGDNGPGHQEQLVIFCHQYVVGLPGH